MTATVAVQEKQTFETTPKLFGKWSYDGIEITDQCFIDYIAVKSDKSNVFVPHTAGRYQQKSFRKATCPIVERLVGSLQFHGRNTGKKVKAIRIVRHAFEIIHLLTGRNPLEVLIKAIIQAGPREDSTRIGSGGVVRKQAVDVSPIRRVNQAIYLIANGINRKLFRCPWAHFQVDEDCCRVPRWRNHQHWEGRRPKELLDQKEGGNRKGR